MFTVYNNQSCQCTYIFKKKLFYCQNCGLSTRYGERLVPNYTPVFLESFIKLLTAETLLFCTFCHFFFHCCGVLALLVIPFHSAFKCFVHSSVNILTSIAVQLCFLTSSFNFLTFCTAP